MPASDNGRFITGTKARKPRTEIPSLYQDAGTGVVEKGCSHGWPVRLG